MSATLTVDFAADAAYLRLSEGNVVETCEVSAGVLADLDEMRIVIGVEVLALNAYIPRDRLVTEFHMRADDLAVLDIQSHWTFLNGGEQPDPEAVRDICDDLMDALLIEDSSEGQIHSAAVSAAATKAQVTVELSVNS